MPDVEVDVLRTSEPSLNVRRHRGMTANTLKLEMQEDKLKELGEGNVALMDCDMMFMGDISDVFEQDFDVGYIARPDPRIPINGGVIFVKINERSLDFFKQYREANDRMYKDKMFHNVYKSKYHGMNQAAFGYMLENYKGGAKVVAFPSEIYDACEDTWSTAMEKAKVIHFKGRLRRLTFDGDDGHSKPEIPGEIIRNNPKAHTRMRGRVRRARRYRSYGMGDYKDIVNRWHEWEKDDISDLPNDLQQVQGNEANA